MYLINTKVFSRMKFTKQKIETKFLIETSSNNIFVAYYNIQLTYLCMNLFFDRKNIVKICKNQTTTTTKGPSLFYVSTFLDFFWPTHPF